MATEQFANTATSTLTQAIGSGSSSLIVASATNFPTTGQFRVKIDSEILLVTAVSGTTFTVTRGAEGTVAATHATGATVTHTLTAGAIAQLKTDIATNATTYFIPDPTSWTDTGTVSPVYNTPVMRIGSTLYTFGGSLTSGSTTTSKIYSAPYAAGVPTFTDTGATMPVAATAYRVAIINDGSNTKIWAFGTQNNDTQHIMSAPIGTPLVWTDVTAGGGSTLSRADNSGFVVANGFVMVIRGNFNGTGGGGLTSIQYTLTTHPGTGWATTGTMFPTGHWEIGAFALRGSVIDFGGVAFNGYGQHVCRTMPLQNNLTNNLYTNVQTVLPVAAPNTPIACDNGKEVFVLGFGTQDVLVGTVGIELVPDWRRLSTVLPATASYVAMNAPWVGPDGYAYYINQPNGHIIKSGRKAVHVTNTIPPTSDPYTPLYGYLDDNTPAIVSRHVLSGNAPWLNNLTTAY